MSSRPILLILALICTVLCNQSLQAAQVNWRSNLESAKLEANRTGKLVLIHFYTTSCGPCKKLERDVFSQPQIAATMEQDYVPFKLNADEAPALANAYRIKQVPTEIILSPQGSVVQKLSCPLEPNAYGSQLVKVAQHYRLTAGSRPAQAQPKVNSAYAGLKIGQTNTNPQTTQKEAPTSKPPVAPAMTRNPYVAFAPPAAPQRPVMPPQASTPASGTQSNRYAAAKPQAKVSAEPAITPTPQTPPTAVNVPVVASKANPASGQSITPPVTQQQTVAAPQMVKRSWPPQLPPNAPQLAFDGYCPVSLRQSKKWIRGEQSYGAIHRGRTYLFAGDAQRKTFLANPDSYSPVFSGNDPVKMLDENQEVAGSRKYGFEYRNAYYLFSSKETMERFATQPDKYSIGVRQAMNRMDATGDGTIRR